MAETRESKRKCPKCQRQNKTVYLRIQEWGRTKEGKMEYRLTCPECAHNELPTEWNGR